MGWRLEVIQFHDDANQSVVQRVPADGTADIKYGAQLIVSQNQEAIFFNDGRAFDSFGPGRYTLETKNLPIITRILTIPWEKSPFQACVYFIGKQTFLDQKWGTRQPIIFRDKDFGVVRLRSFGKYTFRVMDSALLLNTIVGTQGKYTTDEVTAFQKDLIVSRMTDILGSMNLGLLDLAARYDEIANMVRDKVADDFSKYGLELVDFFINAITPPDEVQKAIDARSSMGVVGDLNAYLRYQTAQSLGKMAETGQTGNPLGMGVGFGMGMAIPGMMNQPGGMPPAPAALPAIGGGNRPTNQPEVGKLEVAELAREAIDPREFIKRVAESAKWPMQDLADEIVLTLPIGTMRKQKVHVVFDRRDEDGLALTSFRSMCGPATEKNALTLLRFNSKLAHGAFAVTKVGEADAVVLQANMLNDSLNVVSVTQVVSALAYQADQVEEKLSGGDQH